MGASADQAGIGHSAVAQDECSWRLMLQAARLLLEYNVRSAVLAQRLSRLATHLGLKVQVLILYRIIILHSADGRSFQVQVPECRINVAVSAGALGLIDCVCAGDMPPAEALAQMEALVQQSSRHRRWALMLLFGSAAAAIAWILHADVGAAAVGGVASALGLLVRQILGRRHWPLLTLPFVAAAIGGVMGGMAVRLNWTQTPALCLVVPALMLVPGPHLLNGLYDLFDNYIPTGIARLMLAGNILVAATAGTLFGGWFVMGLRNVPLGVTSGDLVLTLWVDMVLAGVAACGFGAFYNTPWRMLWIAIVCGMVGHGVRFIGLAEGASPPLATLLACLCIGLMAGFVSRNFRLPFSSLAFAAAVPMMPGTLIYRTLAGAAQLSRAGMSADAALGAAVLGLLFQAALVVLAMVAGLMAGGFAAGMIVTAISRAGSGASSRLELK